MTITIKDIKMPCVSSTITRKIVYTEPSAPIRCVCVTHENCLDGLFSAALINRIMEIVATSARREKISAVYDIKYIEKNYSKKFTDEEILSVSECDIVFIVDVSLTLEDITTILTSVSNKTLVVWIDHHETSIKTYKQLKSENKTNDRLSVILDIKVSASMLIKNNMWYIVDQLCIAMGMPRLVAHNDIDKLTVFTISETNMSSAILSLVKFVDDRDRWVYAYDNTKPITTYLYSKFIGEKTSKGTYGDKVEALLGIPNTDIEHMIKIGEEMISIVENTTKRIFNNHTPPVYNETLGYEIVTINSPVFQSELGNLGYDKYPNAVIVVYNINLSIGKVILSLRSHNDGPNVAEIAEKFGGGGHAHAAGFTVSIVDFISIMQIERNII